MLRVLPLAALLLASPAMAFDISDMSEAERADFRAEIRSYLLENPDVLTEAIAVLERREADEQAQADTRLLAENMDALINDGHSLVTGNPDGDITIVEFLDYRCGYCKRAYPEVTELLERDGNIRLIVKEFPILGEGSVLASRFAIAVKRLAGDDAYEQVHDTLMLIRSDISQATLERVAEDAGLDMAEITREMSDPAIDAIIAENRALGQRLGINGTPSFVFGDQMVRGYVPLDAMEQIVAEERAG